MGISDKSKHVGNHGGAYTDQDGMSRQFTYVDYDIKPKFTPGSGSTSLFNRQWEYMEKYILDNIDTDIFKNFIKDNDLIWGEFNFAEMSKLSKLLGLDLSVMNIRDPDEDTVEKEATCKITILKHYPKK